MNEVAYEKFIVLFRRMKYLGVAEALLGLLMGVLAGGTTRVVIWVVAGVLAVWTFITGFFWQRRYQRLLASSQAAQSYPTANTPSNQMPLEVPSAKPIPASSTEWEARRVEALRSYERFFAGAALLGVGVAVAGVVGGQFLEGPAEATVTFGVGGGGLLMSALFLVVRKRVHTGPKAVG